jgi:hypothetical protein
VCAFLFEQSKKKIVHLVSVRWRKSQKSPTKKKDEISSFSFFYKLKIGDFPIKWRVGGDVISKVRGGGKKIPLNTPDSPQCQEF